MRFILKMYSRAAGSILFMPEADATVGKTVIAL